MRYCISYVLPLILEIMSSSRLWQLRSTWNSLAIKRDILADTKSFGPDREFSNPRFSSHQRRRLFLTNSPNDKLLQRVVKTNLNQMKPYDTVTA